MRSAAARAPSRTGPLLPTLDSVESWLGVNPASSCLRSRRDSRRTATRRRAASMARWPGAGSVPADPAPGETGLTGEVPASTGLLLNPEDTLAAYVRTGRRSSSLAALL